MTLIVTGGKTRRLQQGSQATVPNFKAIQGRHNSLCKTRFPNQLVKLKYGFQQTLRQGLRKKTTLRFRGIKSFRGFASSKTKINMEQANSNKVRCFSQSMCSINLLCYYVNVFIIKRQLLPDFLRLTYQIKKDSKQFSRYASLRFLNGSLWESTKTI